MPEVSIERLRMIEWSGEIQGDACCPVCTGRRPSESPLVENWLPEVKALYGHKGNCWLGRIIDGALLRIR